LPDGSITYSETTIIIRYLLKANTFSSEFLEILDALCDLLCRSGEQLHWRRILSAHGTMSLRFSARLAFAGCVWKKSEFLLSLSNTPSVCQILTDSRTS
jgi:hypothetical protein